MKSKLLLALLFLIIASPSEAQLSITIDPSVHHQTIEGWGDGGDLFAMMNYLVDPVIGDPMNRQTGEKNITRRIIRY
jgi:hypothetical protein